MTLDPETDAWLDQLVADAKPFDERQSGELQQLFPPLEPGE